MEVNNHFDVPAGSFIPSKKTPIRIIGHAAVCKHRTQSVRDSQENILLSVD
jgi:hypothetical protein